MRPKKRKLPHLVRLDDGFERRTDPGRGFRAWFAATVLRLGGWTIGAAPPKLDKYVIIAAPHTTWWDGFWMLAFAWYWGIDLSWMGKASLTKGPLGWIPRKFGVIPVDRSAPHGLVADPQDGLAGGEARLGRGRGGKGSPQHRLHAGHPVQEHRPVHRDRENEVGDRARRDDGNASVSAGSPPGFMELHDRLTTRLAGV